MTDRGRRTSRPAAAVLATALAIGTVVTGGWSAGAAQAAVRPCSRGLVALTFDDGPAAAVTGRLVDVLSALHVPATFFVVGSRVDAAPWLVRHAAAAGLDIANHTYGHETLTRLSDGGIRGTLTRTDRAVRRAGARPVPLMRPPYGATDDRVRRVAGGLGLTEVLWDVDSRDWESGTAAQITSRVLAGLRPGGRNIVLLHDGVRRSPTTLAAVPGIVRGARDRGYCFARLGPGGGPVPPVPALAVADARVTESDPGSPVRLRYRLRLDRPTSRAVSVRVRTVPVTTSAGADHRTVSRRVDFPAGSRSRTVSVRVRGDRIDEQTERVRLVADRPRGVHLVRARGVGRILDDDPVPRVSLTGTSVVEPPEGRLTAYVQVETDRPSSRRMVVVVATVPGSAGESDYLPAEHTVTLPPGRRRASVPVTVLADMVDEPEEAFELRVVAVEQAVVAEGSALVAILPATEG